MTIAVLIFLLSTPLFATSDNVSATAYERIEKVSCEFTMRDQGETSTCWLHSALMMMEQMAKVNLSVDAIIISEIRSRAMMRFLGHDTPWDGGAGPTRPFALALEHGLVPESVWRRGSVLIKNYSEVFSKIEELLALNFSKHEFLTKLDDVIREYTYDLPPTEFVLGGQKYTAKEFAKKVIGSGASVGYDFRPLHYDDSVYGRMGEVAWTNIITQSYELLPIRQVINKVVVRVDAEEAFQKVIEIFKESRPVAVTFIWADHENKRVLALNDSKEYVSVRPSAVGSYTSSHLVLVTGLMYRAGQVAAFQILDPLAPDVESGRRILTREFFFTHGKTVHEISPLITGCNQLLTP